MDRQRRTWTHSEIEHLKNRWGEATPNKIAKELGRTTTAIIVKSKVLGLGSFLDNSEYLNAYQITQLMGIDSHVIQRTWKNHGFKMKKRRIRGNKQFEVITLEELLKWLKEHQELWDSRKIPEYGLGTEPAWLKEKRRIDELLPAKSRGTKYTPAEDNKLVMMCRLGKTQAEIAEALGRTEASVNGRVQRLDIWGTGRLKNAN